MAGSREAKRRQDLERLVSLGEMVSLEAVTGPRSVLEKAAKSACELSGADYAVIFPYDPDRRRFYDSESVVASSSDKDHSLEKPPELRFAAILRNIGELAVHDVHKGDLDQIGNPDIDRASLLRIIQEEEFIRKAGVNAFVGLSLKARTSERSEQQDVGVVLIAFRTPHHFTDGELQLIRIFGHQIGSAIQIALLLQSERHLRQQAETLREVSGAISSALELGEVTETILDGLKDVVDYHKASIQLIRGDTRKMLAYRGFDSDASTQWLVRRVSWDRLASRIVKTQEPLILSETLKDPDWESRPGTQDIQSWVGLPLVYGRETIGLLTLEHNVPRFYTNAIEGLLVAFAHQATIAIENARLFDDARRRIRDLEIVNQVTQVISSKLETHDLLQTIVFQIAQQLNCTQCTLFFPQQQDGELVPRVSCGPGSEEEAKTRRFKMGEGLVGWVFQHGESLVLANAQDDPRFACAKTDQDRPRSMLVVPVKVGERTIGVLSAEQDGYDWFHESDLRLVDALASQAGIAIERATGLDLLQDVGMRIISAQNTNEILVRIVAGAIQLVGAVAGVIYLVSEDGRSIIQEFSYPPGFDYPLPRMEKGGVVARIVDNGEVLIYPNISQEPLANPMIHERVQSAIAIPLKLREKVIGVLFLNDTKPRDFTDTEVSLLLTLASQAAIAIQNTRLLTDLQRQVKGHMTLNSVGARLLGTLDEETILSQVARSVADTLDCTHCSVFKLERGKLVVKAAEGNREWSLHLGRTFEQGAGVAGWVAQEGQPALVADTSQDERHVGGWSMPQADPRSLVVAPILLEGKVHAVISAEQDRKAAFDSHDLRLLETLSSQASQAIRNARLYADLELQVERLRTLNQVSRTLSSGLDDESIFRTVNEAVVQTLGCTHCTYFALRNNLLIPQTTSSATQEHKITRSLVLGEGLAGWVAQSGTAIVVQDTKEDKHFTPSYHTRPETDRSMLVVPAWVEGKVIGVFSADKDRVNAFDEADLQFLETLAVQAGVAIQQERQQRQRVEAVRRRFNPYIIGEPIREPERFYGRKQFIQEIVDGIHNNNYIIYGERRIGKTSLLIQIAHQLEQVSEEGQGYRFVPIPASLQGVPEAEFFVFLMTSIARAVALPREELASWSNWTHYGHYDFEDDLETAIRILQNRYPHNEIRIVLLLDEMDQFVGYNPQVHERFRSVFTTGIGAHLKMVMAGVSIHRVVRARTSPWYNLFKEIELPAMDRMAARQLVMEPVLGYYTYQHEAIESILNRSDLKPHEIQRLAFLSVCVMLDRIGAAIDRTDQVAKPTEIMITAEDVETATELALRDKDGEYREFWNQLLEDQSQILVDAVLKDSGIDLDATRPDGTRLFTQEDLYNIAWFSEKRAQLTYLFMEWLRRTRL